MYRKTTLRMTKGQLLSMDAVASVVLFIVALVFIFSLWNLYTIRLAENIASEEMQLVAFQVTDILVQSQGVPNIWEQDPDTVEVIGLQSNPGLLDDDKLAAFLAMDYDAAKAVFNIERFEYNFTVLNVYGDVLNSTGMPLSATAAQRVAVHRIVLINNQTRNVLFALWREK